MTTPSDPPMYRPIWIALSKDERGRTVVDHGYYDTGEGVVLPPERPQELGAKWCRVTDRWYLQGEKL